MLPLVLGLFVGGILDFGTCAVRSINSLEKERQQLQPVRKETEDNDA